MSKTQKILQLLRDYESRNVTFVEENGSWPIVWERARGVHVWDAEGKKYLDFTAAFGVAAAGHANSSVVKAGQQQMAKLLHAMGDVHPHELKAKLARELSRITFERWTKRPRVTGKTIFCNSGFEAVEAALKTAKLATGKGGVIAFKGAYHGLGYGALNATHRDHFRTHFRTQLREFAHFVSFPRQRSDLSSMEQEIRSFLRTEKIGAVLVEPIQARGGINIPPADFLPMLRRICDDNGMLLILDEIYSGFGRTGKWFACEQSKTVPDIICLGKALTGGFPLSACVGRVDLMDSAWPPSAGEAIHTSTFLGHPVGCAMALAQIREIENKNLVHQSAGRGRFLVRELRKHLPARKFQSVYGVRGVGLMAGIEFRQRDSSPDTATSLRVMKEMLHRGFILLPEGEHAEVISFTPPLTVTENDIVRMVRALADVLEGTR